jgi:TPR repeat protein
MVIRKYMSILVLMTCISSSSGAELSKEQEYECLSLIAVLPVMGNAKMQALAKDEKVYQKGGSSLLVHTIQNLADAGDPEALYSLGVLYENGYCVPKDLEKGLSLYKEAARRGSQEAKKRLSK